MRTTQTKLAMYEGERGERVTAADTVEGRLLASGVLYGSQADAEAASPTGFRVMRRELTHADRAHLARHGWC